MVKSTFHKAMPYVLEEEGGYVDNPREPGGATNMGITLRTLSAWFGHPVSKSDVLHLTKLTAYDIYKSEFWNKINADALPAGLDYALFDFAINSGPARAARTLQEIVGATQDGIIGASTLSAINSRSPVAVITALCERRKQWLSSLTTYSHSGRGWFARVDRARVRALDFASDATPLPSVIPRSANAKARQRDLSIRSILQKPEAFAPVAAATSGVIATFLPNPFAKTAFALIMLALVGYGLQQFIKRLRTEP